MSFQPLDYHEALRHFHTARQQAALQSVLARLSGKSNELLSYDEVARQLKLAERTDRGIQSIPLEAIVGSVGRYTDFTRTFLPRSDADKERWARVMAATTSPGSAGLPPIEVYKVGEVYFVLDGHHRVSAARQAGATHIEAYVTEVHTEVPLTPDIQPDDIIIKAEYADFLERTRLNALRPGADLSLTAPGQYAKLLHHIEVHRYFMGLEQKRFIPEEEAVTSWYDDVYMSVILAIRERGLLRRFPGRTEADLYLWVADHRAGLEKELGWAVRPEAAVEDLALREGTGDNDELTATGNWRRFRLASRYIDRLFADILIPLSGSEESWTALEQALHIARREAAQVHGLHIAPETLSDDTTAQTIRERFDALCAVAGVTGNLIIESGEIARKICERALLADVVVLKVSHPPSSNAGLLSWNSGLRSIIWNCARPTLTVPGAISALNRPLLAYDGSPKAKEALFVAAYLAERWRTPLTVVTVGEGNSAQTIQDYARAYLELHEIEAEYVITAGVVGEKLLQARAEREADLVLMGGYGRSPWQEMVLGSVVNFMLREAPCPVFICR